MNTWRTLQEALTIGSNKGGLCKFFCEGPHSTYFQLFGPHGLLQVVMPFQNYLDKVLVWITSFPRELGEGDEYITYSQAPGLSMFLEHLR